MKRSYLHAWGSASFVQQPSNYPPDAGAGAGGDGAASPGGAGAGDGAGGNVPAAIKLSADTLVDLGDGKPARWGELTSGEKARFMPRENYDRGVKYLETEAQRLQRQWDESRQRETRGQQQQRQQQTPRDPFGTLRGRPVVDGDTIAKTLEEMHSNGFGPMAQAFAAMVKEVTDLKQSLTETRQMFAPHQETRARLDFDAMVSSTIGKIEAIKGMPEGGQIDPADPFIKELAEDLHSSFEPDSWRPGEYDKLLKGRIEGAIAFVRALDKSALGRANEIRRQSFFPAVHKGGGQGSGAPKYKHESGSQIAARAGAAGLFGNRQSA